MAAEPIHVDPAEEVPSIIERIRHSASDEVQLVLPAGSRFGQSRFNFQLLKQYTTRLGKRVAVWSPDPAVQRMAEESGFGAFRPEPNDWRPPAAAPAVPGPAPPAQRGQPPVRTAAPFAPGARGPYAGPLAPGAPRAPGSLDRLGGIARITRQNQAGMARAIRIGSLGRRLPSQMTMYEPARYVLYGGAVLVLLAGILAVLFYMPTARVTLVAQAQPFTTNVDVTADPSAKSTVHVRTVTVTKTVTGQGQATGTRANGGQLAAGEFTYVNNCPIALTVGNGQRLRSVSGVLFAQLGDVSVEQSKQQTVSIKAVQPGQAGNVGAGQITGIEMNTYPCLTGTNHEPTNGGTDEQKQTVIQSSDVQSLRANLRQQLQQQIQDELDKGLQKGETRVGQPQFSNETFNTTHNPDDNVPNFTATLQLTAEGDYFWSDDVARRFTDALASKVPQGQQLTTNKVVPNYQVTAAPGGHLDFNGSASGYIAPTIDIENLKSQLAGKPATQAHDLLTRLPVQRSVISQTPPLPLMPFSASRISIDYGVEAQAPARSA